MNYGPKNDEWPKLARTESITLSHVGGAVRVSGGGGVLEFGRDDVECNDDGLEKKWNEFIAGLFHLLQTIEFILMKIA